MERKNFFERFTGHLKTVLTHKYYVAEGCMRCGLYFQSIVHDLSKFSPAEFSVGVKYFHGHRSPNAIERSENEGLSTAWLHHKGRNKHHYEYWVDFGGLHWPKVYPNRMPMKYVIEMACDRRAACITYNRENYTPAAAYEHYMKNAENQIMHPDTRAVLEACLKTMADSGEAEAFLLMKRLLKVTKGRDYSIDILSDIL